MVTIQQTLIVERMAMWDRLWQWTQAAVLSPPVWPIEEVEQPGVPLPSTTTITNADYTTNTYGGAIDQTRQMTRVRENQNSITTRLEQQGWMEEILERQALAPASVVKTNQDQTKVRERQERYYAQSQVERERLGHHVQIEHSSTDTKDQQLARLQSVTVEKEQQSRLQSTLHATTQTHGHTVDKHHQRDTRAVYSKELTAPEVLQDTTTVNQSRQTSQTTVSVSPTIHLQATIYEKANVEELVTRLGRLLEEELAISAERAYT